jgi:hypothetical protein
LQGWNPLRMRDWPSTTSMKMDSNLLQADMSSTSALLASIVNSVCVLIGEGWNLDKTSIESFLLSLAAYVRERLAQVK